MSDKSCFIGHFHYITVITANRLINYELGDGFKGRFSNANYCKIPK